MPYNGKTDWKLNDTVYPEDMNRIEGQIGKNTSEIEGVSGKIGNSSDNEEQLTLFGKLAAILAKVLGIVTKVGTSDDAKTKPTLFGKIAGIGDTLSENLTPVTEKITEVLNKVTGIDTNVKTVLNGVGYVKSTDGRKYAAIMEGVAVKLPTVQKGSTTFSVSNNNYRGFAKDAEYFYVSTSSSIYKVKISDLSFVKKVSYSGAEIFGCDDEYLYAAKDRYIIKFNKSTLSQVAISSSSINHEGDYDGSVLDGDYIYTTMSGGVYYSKVDKKTLSILQTSSGLGDSGNRLMASCGSYIVVCPFDLFRLSKTDLESYAQVSSSAVGVKVLLCDSQFAYVLGSSKYQKFNVATKEKITEVNSSVTPSLYYNFDCQNDDFLFLVPSSGGKAKKISKVTLEAITETEEDVAKVFFADDTYIYCATSDNKPAKIEIAPESGSFNITGFKEV